MREILLGFDARKRAPPFPAEYRSTYLLRDDAESVLSVDTMLWPSTIGDTPEWIGANAPFWEDLERLERHIPSSTPQTLIAATWHMKLAERTGLVGPYESPTTPASRDPNWTLFGYDIADP